MLKQKYFLTGIFILSAERQPIKLAWRKIVWLLENYGISLVGLHLIIQVPPDRESEFGSIVVPKHQSRGLSIECLVIFHYHQ